MIDFNENPGEKSYKHLLKAFDNPGLKKDTMLCHDPIALRNAAFWAAKVGDFAFLQNLNQWFPDLEMKDEQDVHVLHWAAVGGHVELIDKLHTAFGFDVKAETSNHDNIVDCAALAQKPIAAVQLAAKYHFCTKEESFNYFKSKGIIFDNTYLLTAWMTAFNLNLEDLEMAKAGIKKFKSVHTELKVASKVFAKCKLYQERPVFVLASLPQNQAGAFDINPLFLEVPIFDGSTLLEFALQKIESAEVATVIMTAPGYDSSHVISKLSQKHLGMYWNALSRVKGAQPELFDFSEQLKKMADSMWIEDGLFYRKDMEIFMHGLMAGVLMADPNEYFGCVCLKNSDVENSRKTQKLVFRCALHLDDSEVAVKYADLLAKTGSGLIEGTFKQKLDPSLKLLKGLLKVALDHQGVNPKLIEVMLKSTDESNVKQLLYTALEEIAKSHEPEPQQEVAQLTSDLDGLMVNSAEPDTQAFLGWAAPRHLPEQAPSDQVIIPKKQSLHP